MQYLLRLAGSLGLSLQIGRGRTAREETGEQWLDEGVENDLGATIHYVRLCLRNLSNHHIPELREGHPENKDELEDVVEG